MLSWRFSSHFLSVSRVTTPRWEQAQARCRAVLWGWQGFLGHYRALSQLRNSSRNCECEMLFLGLLNQYGVCFWTKDNIYWLLSLTALTKEQPMWLKRTWPRDSAQLGFDPTSTLSLVSYPLAFVGLDFPINKMGIKTVLTSQDTGLCLNETYAKSYYTS